MTVHIDRHILVSARWEIETAFLIADLIRHGTPPSKRNLERLALCCDSLTQVIGLMGGDKSRIERGGS